MIPIQPSVAGAGMGGMAGQQSSSATSAGGNDEIAQRTLTNITTSVNSGAGARGPVFNFGGTLDASATNAPKGIPTWIIIAAGVAVLALGAFLVFRKK
jgi:hypothetical protein